MLRHDWLSDVIKTRSYLRLYALMDEASLVLSSTVTAAKVAAKAAKAKNIDTKDGNPKDEDTQSKSENTNSRDEDSITKVESVNSEDKNTQFKDENIISQDDVAEFIEETLTQNNEDQIRRNLDPLISKMTVLCKYYYNECISEKNQNTPELDALQMKLGFCNGFLTQLIQQKVCYEIGINEAPHQDDKKYADFSKKLIKIDEIHSKALERVYQLTDAIAELKISRDAELKAEANSHGPRPVTALVSALEALTLGFAEEIDKALASGQKLSNTVYPAAIWHFSQLTEKFANPNDPVTLEHLTDVMNHLDRRVYGKQPMSPTTKALVCGVLGAMVGFVLGAIAGALITAPAMGAGAFGGALCGAIMGFKLGTMIAGGAAITSSVATSSFGLFTGRRANKRFDRQTKEWTEMKLASINPVTAAMESLGPVKK